MDNSPPGRLIYRLATAITSGDPSLTLVGGAMVAAAMPYVTTSGPGLATPSSVASDRITMPRVSPVTDANHPTHREVDAQIAAAEARSTTREATLSGKLDLVLERLGNLGTSIGEVRNDVRDARREGRGIGVAIILTTIGTVIAAALAVQGLVEASQGTMTTANGNVLSALQAGLAVKDANAGAAATATAPQGRPAK